MTKQLQACNHFELPISTQTFVTSKIVHMHNKNLIIPGPHPGEFHLPDDNKILYLNPVERTIYLFFINHPEGILTDALPLHWQELYKLYSHESVFDDKKLMLNTIETLCGESKVVFYSNVSRIKRKFINTLGVRKARHYIVIRHPDGYYRIGCGGIRTQVIK